MKELLTALGKEIFVETENMIDMATSLSATGPTYIFTFMDRRQSLKALGVSTVSAGILLEACKTNPKEAGSVSVPETGNNADRQPIEIEKDKKLNAETFFYPT